MDIATFLKEHGLNCRSREEEIFMWKALDKMYLELQTEQIVRLVLDYCDKADDIYNDTSDTIKEGLEKVLALDEEK